MLYYYNKLSYGVHYENMPWVRTILYIDVWISGHHHLPTVQNNIHVHVHQFRSCFHKF